MKTPVPEEIIKGLWAYPTSVTCMIHTDSGRMAIYWGCGSYEKVFYTKETHTAEEFQCHAARIVSMSGVNVIVKPQTEKRRYFNPYNVKAKK